MDTDDEAAFESLFQISAAGMGDKFSDQVSVRKGSVELRVSFWPAISASHPSRKIRVLRTRIFPRQAPHLPNKTMPNEIVFLFGAGASKGAGHVDPYCPPVMQHLYEELARSFPEKWGPGSSMDKHEEKFRQNFEEAFAEIVLRVGKDNFGPLITPPSLSILEAQCPLALYFSRFVLDSSGLDCYSKLLSRLKDSGKIPHCLFGSINYDCLFEQAALKLGLWSDYDCIHGESAQVAKLHGSCNFITTELSGQRHMLAGQGVHYEVQLNFLPVVNLEATLRCKISGIQPAHLPVMSQVSPGKEDVLAPRRILEIRQKWAIAVSAAATVVIIGVSYNQNDTHIVEAIRKAPAKLLYIGDDESFKAWKAVNGNTEYISETFEKGFNLLLHGIGI